VKTVQDQPCEICGVPFSPRNRVARTCSLDCSIQWRRKLARERQAPTPRWCKSCRTRQEDRRARKRVAVRRCHKCQIAVPDAERKPGLTVCDGCRVDKRKVRTASQRRRTLRQYGLAQEEFDGLLIAQAGRCPGCGTDDPGAKGWCIDHCHSSGRVRALLCGRCNSVVGLSGESPATLRALADFVERWQLSLIEPSTPPA
jgi:hypothetical protein